jgi:hypothetical protein
MSDAPHQEPVKVITEQTSKAIKLRVLLCNVAAGFGFVGMVASPPNGWKIGFAAIFFGSIGYYCWLKFERQNLALWSERG